MNSIQIKKAEKQSVDRASINHTDNSVGRSQPEALIIHTYTYTQEQGGSSAPMITTKQPTQQ